MAKAFYFHRAYNRNGQEVVAGGVKIYLRKPYGSQTLENVREVMGQNGPRTVCNVEGSVKLDQYMVKQIAYFFNVNLSEGSFLQVRVGVWGSMGKALSKFPLNEGDCYLFMASNVRMESFSKRDGSTGYQIVVTAFDFEHIPTNGKNAQNNNAGQNAGQPRQNNVQQRNQPAPTPAPAYTGPSADDFAAIDESEDLPF